MLALSCSISKVTLCDLCKEFIMSAFPIHTIESAPEAAKEALKAVQMPMASFRI